MSRHSYREELWEENKQAELKEAECYIKEKLSKIGCEKLVEQVKIEGDRVWVGEDFYFATNPTYNYLQTRYWTVRKIVSLITPKGGAGWEEVSREDGDMEKAILGGLLYLVANNLKL